MLKKALIFTILVMSMIFTFSLTLGADEFTDNKCFDEWTWCNGGTEDEQAYWWEAGWCAAAIDAGFITGSVEDCTSSPDDTYTPFSGVGLCIGNR